MKRTRGATTQEPHGEEALLQRRLEPWTLLPSFETHRFAMLLRSVPSLIDSLEVKVLYPA
jgi:hypothetical protein